MKKKLLSLLLAFTLALSLAPAALAETGGARKTDFFTDQTHADLHFEDIQYERIDPEPFMKEADAIRALLKDADSAGVVQQRYDDLWEQVDYAYTMLALLTIQSYQDVSSEEVSEEMSSHTLVFMDLQDAFFLLTKDILSSPCGGFLKERFSEEEIAEYLEYAPLTDKERALSARETELNNQYLAAYGQSTVEYEGRTWDQSGADAALLSGEISSDVYNELSNALLREENRVLGEIYLELLDIHEQQLDSTWNSCADYYYEIFYLRDYAPKDVQDFNSAVKTYIAPLFNDLLPVYFSSTTDTISARDFSGDAALDLIEPYIGRISSEMAEAFAYMREHGLYDTALSPLKGSMTFTACLASYGAPFYFANPGSVPNSGIYDFSAAVHEFGHYNHFYWHGSHWDAVDCMDTSEVHSQGLELLVSHFFPEIFGEYSEEVSQYQILSMLSGIIDGCLFDELEQYAHETKDVTLEQLNRKYRQLFAEYGLVDPEDPREELYDWVTINHLFTSPFYYISYAVSAAGALSFWLDAQEDYFAAVDDYLSFTALDPAEGFQASFEAVGMDNPFTPAYLEQLSKTIRENLELEDLPPADLTGTEWFAEAACALYAAGILEKDGEDCVRPLDNAAWADAVSLLTGLEKTVPAPEDSGAVITRLEFVRLLAEAFEIAEAGASPFSDTEDGLVSALAALEAVSGYADGTFRPQQPITRCEMWAMAYRLLLAVADPLAEDLAA